MDNISLQRWFLSEQRDLPWREDKSPYAVWVSEIMLQQTQVSVVIPYFLRWMQLFPNIEALANADLNDVIKAWEGLGYYSRARNLHLGAKQVKENFNGELPSQKDQLASIKGIGPYTVGAILSFAFNQKAAAVDGNVIRVLSRYYAFSQDLSKPSSVKVIWKMAEDLLPDIAPWTTNEALIELGATVCSKKPKCDKCPLKRSCKGYSLGIASSLPLKTKKMTTEQLTRAVLIAIFENKVLVEIGQKGQIMEGLYYFPFFDSPKEGLSTEVFLKNAKNKWGGDFKCLEKWEAIQHSFTRYQATLLPFVCSFDGAVKTGIWLPIRDLEKVTFCAGHREIRDRLLGLYS